MTLGHLQFNRDDLAIVFDTENATAPPFTLTGGQRAYVEYHYWFTMPSAPVDNLTITGIATE